MERTLSIFLFIAIVTSGFNMGFGEFRRIESCICAGSIVTYKCTADGPGFTIWRGSAFNCPAVNSEIFLRHSLYDTQSGSSGQCNNGAIVGSSLSSSGGANYTSQLIINLAAASAVIGRAIECIYRNPEGVETLIDSDTINILNEPFSPPSDVQLASVHFNELKFNWTRSSVENACSNLQYSIDSDCGTCSNATNVVMPSISCSIHTSDYNKVCRFAISSVVCDTMTGNFSNQVSVPLRVPEPPLLRVTPTYNHPEGALIRMNITFSEMESVGFSSQIDGSPENYTMVYNNAVNNCYSVNIPATSCKLGVCTKSLSKSSLLNCSKYEDIIIFLRATNKLGTGSSSNTTISSTNDYVDVMIKSNGSIICNFLDQRSRQVVKLCEIMFGRCEQQKDTILKGNAFDVTTDSIRIDIPAAYSAQSFCYTVKASYNNFTINIEGMYKGTANTYNSVLIGGVIGGVAVLCLIISAIIIIVTLFYCVWQRSFVTGLGGISQELGVVNDMDKEKLYEAHVVFDVEDKAGQLLQALRVFHKDYDISTLYLGCHRDGVRKVCIKFDIESDAFELDFDTFTKGLDPNNQPPDIMRKSIKVHREPTSLTAKDIWNGERPSDDTGNDTMSIESVNKRGAVLKILQGLEDIGLAQKPSITLNIIDVEIKTEPNQSGKILITVVPGISTNLQQELIKRLPEKCEDVKSVTF